MIVKIGIIVGIVLIGFVVAVFIGAKRVGEDMRY